MVYTDCTEQIKEMPCKLTVDAEGLLKTQELLQRATESVEKEYLESVCEIMRFQTAGLCDLMCRRTKISLGFKTWALEALQGIQ
jgi:hypothetical protein